MKLRLLLLILPLVLNACTMREYVAERSDTSLVVVQARRWKAPADASQTMKARSKAAFDRGTQAREKKAFESAADDFDVAYRLAIEEPAAELSLFLAAESHFDAMELLEAHNRYQRFLRAFPQSREYSKVVTRIFDLGKLAIEGKYVKRRFTFFGDYGRDFGRDVLNRFVKDRDRHPNADDALYLIASENLRRGDPIEAIEIWSRVIEEYPDSEWRRLSEYRLAQASMRLTDNAKRDRRPLLEALAQLRRYIRRYPTGDNLPEVQSTVTVLEEELAKEDLFRAKFYKEVAQPNIIVRFFREPAPSEAYEIYLEWIIREYPKTETAKEARQLLRAEGVDLNG